MIVGQSDILGNKEKEHLRKLRQSLDAAGIEYEIFGHSEKVISAEDGVESGIGSLAQMAPTLILETEMGYIAAIISGEDRLSYKKIKKALSLKNVSFAKPEIVQRETGAQVGSVSLVNLGLFTIVDIRVTKADIVFGGCGIPQHTLRIAPKDLITVTSARILDFTEPKEVR